MMEFALVAPFLLGLLIGSFVLGLGMVKALQCQQVNRNAGILFMKYVDLSQPSNQDIIVRTAVGLNMTRTGGNGRVILSQVLYVGPTECAGGGLSVGACPNYNQYVFTKRIQFGNAALTNSAGAGLGSRLGNPRAGIIQPDGNIVTNDYLTDPTARLNWMPMVMSYGEITFVSETWFVMPELYFPKWQLLIDPNPSSPTPYVDNSVYTIYLT
jgi:hypothetical protein